MGSTCTQHPNKVYTKILNSYEDRSQKIERPYPQKVSKLNSKLKFHWKWLGYCSKCNKECYYEVESNQVIHFHVRNSSLWKCISKVFRKLYVKYKSNPMNSYVDISKQQNFNHKGTHGKLTVVPSLRGSSKIEHSVT